MKLSFTGTPRMPPFLLMSFISAAFLPGTPNTEAGPERKVVIAILSSAGLSWAAAALDSNPANSMPASEAFSALRMTVIEPSPPNGTFSLKLRSILTTRLDGGQFAPSGNLASGAARVDNPHIRIRTAQATWPGLSMTSVQALEDLRTSYGPPTALAARKDMDRIDAHARAFIERSPFVVVSTAREDGWP